MNWTVVAIVISLFGVCATGFFFLAVWLRSVVKEVETVKLSVKNCVTYTWFEETFKKELKEDLTKLEAGLVLSNSGLAKEVSKLSEAIMGTVDRRGLLTKFHEHDDRLTRVEVKCEKQHS